MKLCVMLLTYKRTDYAVKTLSSTLRNLKFDGQVSVHIADDGSPMEHRAALIDVATEHVEHISVTNSERGGYGANYNLATQAVHCWADAVLPLEDDWECIKPFDVTPFVYTVLEHEGYELGCVRLGYLGWTQELRGSLLYRNGHQFLFLDQHSAEPHVFAGHPRLESVAFQRRVGPWPHGKLPGDTEFEVAHREEARRGVAWPMCLDPRQGYGLFAHIGQRREWD